MPYTRTLHRRLPQKNQGGLRAAIAVALALVAHGAFLGLLLFLSLFEVPHPPMKRHAAPSSVSVRPLSNQQWAQNRGPNAPVSKEVKEKKTPAPVAKTEKPPEKKTEERPKGQVVDVAPGNGQEDPNANYLAESANKVNKETRAKDQTAHYRNAMPRRTTSTPQTGAGKDNVDKAQIAGNNGMGDDDRPLRDPSDQKAAFELPDVQGHDEVALKTPNPSGIGDAIANRTESERIVGNSNRLNITPGGAAGEDTASQGRRGTPGNPTLIPSDSVLDKISGAAANDHLRDVEEGDGTYLNTREWKFSSFFNRVKQSVGMHWDPGTQLRKRDPTGSIYGGRDRHTLLAVTLNEQGRVTDVYVEKSSGLDFLDIEAIRSFERAQPFPNPPPGLLASDAKIHFSFGFFLDMGSGARFRLFRQAN